MKTRNFKIFLPLLVALTSCVDVIENDEANNLMENKMTQVTIKTSVGDIQLELNDEKAPITVENFKTIASSGYYEGTIFHRVINGFMIQGGGLTADMSNKSSGTGPIQNEANNGLPNDRGTIAMARTMDPHSATSQFFINPETQPPQPPKEQKQDPALQLAAQQIELQKQKAMADMDFKNKKLEADNVVKMQKLNLDEQKLASQIIKEQKVNEMEKEKLASKILQQGLN